MFGCIWYFSVLCFFLLLLFWTDRFGVWIHDFIYGLKHFWLHYIKGVWSGLGVRSTVSTRSRRWNEGNLGSILVDSRIIGLPKNNTKRANLPRYLLLYAPNGFSYRALEISSLFCGSSFSAFAQYRCANKQCNAVMARTGSLCSLNKTYSPPEFLTSSNENLALEGCRPHVRFLI